MPDAAHFLDLFKRYRGMAQAAADPKVADALCAVAREYLKRAAQLNPAEVARLAGSTSGSKAGQQRQS